MNVTVVLIQVQDRIPHQLSRPVIRDVPTPIHPVNRSALPPNPFHGHQEMILAAAPPDRVRDRVFEKEQGIRSGICLSLRNQPFLKRQTVLVAQHSQPGTAGRAAWLIPAELLILNGLCAQRTSGTRAANATL